MHREEGITSLGGLVLRQSLITYVILAFWGRSRMSERILPYVSFRFLSLPSTSVAFHTYSLT